MEWLFKMAKVCVLDRFSKRMRSLISALRAICICLRAQLFSADSLALGQATPPSRPERAHRRHRP
jgi:hypothetical protein